MTLEQAMEYINNIPHIGKRDGVNRVRPLLHLLGTLSSICGSSMWQAPTARAARWP